MYRRGWGLIGLDVLYLVRPCRRACPKACTRSVRGNPCGLACSISALSQRAPRNESIPFLLVVQIDEHSVKAAGYSPILLHTMSKVNAQNRRGRFAAERDSAFLGSAKVQRSGRGESRTAQIRSSRHPITELVTHLSRQTRESSTTGWCERRSRRPEQQSRVSCFQSTSKSVNSQSTRRNIRVPSGAAWTVGT